MSIEASAPANFPSVEAGPSTSNSNFSANGKQQPRTNQPKGNRNPTMPRLTSDQLRKRLHCIDSGSTVILKMPSGRTKAAEIMPGKQVSLGKFGSFKADDLIGMPYGFTYEIQPDTAAPPENGKSSQKKGAASRSGGGSLKLVINRTLGDLETEASETLETTATNEHINDDGSAQKLTYVDIQELKNKGISGREIIEQQLASSESFANRTVYSQAKYVARKEQKHLKLFTPLQPDFGNVCDFWLDKSPEKIRWIRKDALSQVLTFGSVRPGGRYLVVDGVSGLLVGSVLERLGGDGTVIAINDAESPPAFDILPYFNLAHQVTKPVLKVLNWAATESDYAPVFSTQDITEVAPTKTSKDKSRDRKRQANFREVDKVRSDFFAGDFDAVLIACHYDPMSILRRLNPQLGGSASVVVHSPYLQPLVEVQAKMRADEEFINISVTEPWLRKYQVLPGRTHPEMTTSSTAGFILHALRVYGEVQSLRMRNEYLEILAEENKEEETTKRAQKVDEAEEQERDTKRIRIEEIANAEPVAQEQA
ncbi:related to GCD10 - translation initiation factor eIF3 RNA-binding subunit [Melanopsichium pennsylvanicum]|uniref:tRNA (adenine(58)-N(1))-methyltransferase non-catalytic subunit TRM6 n=2 Tax=Melanopsichium pennsylvanicum TaxID=63383 RepID=A0AAJ4XNW3_9BASI|nr:related to GCD10-translation initiation factor eIF3 RNA-binding subunit [Melanopsichium pennsylvanicum 4]SNX85226.1 related to GCD10 - translation initiation factor eIF3 RNA-binding subunit [Melanopsichium pennsylvanicum]